MDRLGQLMNQVYWKVEKEVNKSFHMKIQVRLL